VIDKLDLALLNCLIQNECTTAFRSLVLKEFDIDIKTAAMYKRLQRLIQEGLINYGFTEGKKKTYFITNKGIEFFEGAVK
jgi:DNA-binding PadR family transcriptional regulator